MTPEEEPDENSLEEVPWDEEEKPLSVSPDDNRPFNPLDTKNLGVAVVRALLEKPALPLAGLTKFNGAGIYAIYYRGGLPLYAPMSAVNTKPADPRWPIYIGKAIPPGARKGKFTVEATDSVAIFDRLEDHAKSISQASNLDLSDFVFRYLVVQDLWISLGERLMIAHFAPLWNTSIDGFGNHNPGGGRLLGKVPRWDVLHPGRYWANRYKPRNETADDITREVTQTLANAALPSLALLGGDISGK